MVAGRLAMEHNGGPGCQVLGSTVRTAFRRVPTDATAFLREPLRAVRRLPRRTTAT